MAAVGLILVAVSFALPVQTVERLFSETGPIERGSAYLWIGLGALALAATRPTAGSVAGAVVSLACAAREMDLHRSFTGYSVLKPRFYFMGDQPLSHRALAGLAVLTLAGAGSVLAARVVPTLWRLRSSLPAWGITTVVGLATLVGSKALDRAPMIIEDALGIAALPRTHAVVHAVEEGYESILPVIFGIAVLQHARWRRERNESGPVAGAADQVFSDA